MRQTVLLISLLMLSLAATPGMPQVLYEQHFANGQTRPDRFPPTILLRVEVPEIKMVEVRAEREIFVDISIQETGLSETPGRPKLPVIRKVIEIPEDAQIILKTEVDSQTISLKHPVFPLASPVLRTEGAKSKFCMDTDFYRMDKFSPDVWARVKKIGYIRGRRVVLLDVYPVRYNPGRDTIICASEINLTLELKCSDERKTQRRICKYYSPAFENLQRKIVVNYGAFKADTDSQMVYLIICADDYEKEMLPFKEWKENNGFLVTMVKTSQIPGGDTAEGIKAYIKDAYTYWQVPPTYLLLVGDVEDIPAFIGIKTGSATDLYYTTMSDSDYMPDIFLGRFSCRDTTEIKAIVDKVLHYETNLGTEQWYNQAYFISTTDGDLHTVSEGINRYCMSLWREHGGECDSLWGWCGTGTPIDVAIDDGRAIVNYSGHGGAWRWEGPMFGRGDIGCLSNYGMYPFVCSHACYTGDYSSTECFGEKWVRVEDKGAVAFWGASTVMSCGLDSILQEGMFNAIFYDTLLSLAEMTDRAKYKMWEVWGDIGMTRHYYEGYNLLGDPSMMLLQIDATGIEEPTDQPALPEVARLYQNHPNPFNATTGIGYALPADCWVKLEIYNVLGQKVATLVDQAQKAGYYRVPWRAKVTSGVYFYRIQAGLPGRGEYTATRKMVLLR
ncbi:T9SS type A sorting domain-containing protein [bacterium]|nr:T9SS type A sorting domain-containing protein [bacterium]